MNHFIFKSASRLIKNEPITLDNLVFKKLEQLLSEQRHQRSDLKIINDKLDRMMVDKHLQMQVDEFYENSPPDKIPQDDLG